jgi:hypothetical protein
MMFDLSIVSSEMYSIWIECILPRIDGRSNCGQIENHFPPIKSSLLYVYFITKASLVAICEKLSPPSANQPPLNRSHPALP